jgi:hypothetical protein
MTEPASPKAPRRTLYVLLAVFFLPLLASFVLYYGVGWRPPAGANHGELLEPLRQLPEALRGRLEGKWALVYVGDGACDQACRDALYVARQTHLLLNKDMNRVRRALLATSGCCDHAFLEAQHAGLEVLDAGEPALRQQLLAVLPAGDLVHDLFVVDPLSNIVLRFDTRENPKGLLEDLKKLLKLSHIG